MNIGYVAVGLLIFALALFVWGALGISKYAFRISTGKGVATLLFPPYTFYFSFYELEEEGKEQPIFLWMWGLVVVGVIVAVFWSPLSMVLQGRASELSADIGVDASVEKYKDQSKERPEAKEKPAEEPVDDTAAQPDAGQDLGQDEDAARDEDAAASEGTDDSEGGEETPADGTKE